MMGPRIWHRIPNRTSIQRHLLWPGIGVFRKRGSVIGGLVPTRDARYSATRRKPGGLSGLPLGLAGIGFELLSWVNALRARIRAIAHRPEVKNKIVIRRDRWPAHGYCKIRIHEARRTQRYPFRSKMITDTDGRCEDVRCGQQGYR